MGIDYQGEPVALLTQHGKEQLLTPLLAAALGCKVHHVTGFDTDQLGSFSREVPRPGSQRDAARQKAEIGMRLSGLPVGLASEGAFGPDPMSGMFAWNIEMLIWLDHRHSLEIVGMAQGTGRCAHLQTTHWAEVQAFAHREDFPRHQLVLRPDDQHATRIVKGVADWDTLHAQFQRTQAASATGQVFVETDLRAHANPTRMQTIERAALDLVRRLQSPCPACAAPGHAAVENLAGLPCADCGTPTSAKRGEIWGCVACKHRQTVWRTDLVEASPAHCPYCNP
jgi:hypothetical protein